MAREPVREPKREEKNARVEVARVEEGIEREGEREPV
jgi:hypothetical protein